MTEATTCAPTDEELELLDADCAYDPLDEVEEKDDDEKAETFGYRGTPEEAAPAPAAKPQVPAAERIEQLFDDMVPFKRWFLAILEACRQAQPTAAVEALVDGLQSKRHSVYTPTSFCTMLEAAGALEKLTLDGEPYGEVEPQLEEVEEDGRTYLRPTPPPEAQWRTTAAGLEALADNRPIDALVQIVEEQADYVDVFREILGMCEGDGSSVVQIREQVNTNPVLEYPKKSAQFFMDYLDRNGAIEWDGAWKITQVGRQLLEYLETR
jgi:hypothetical protein